MSALAGGFGGRCPPSASCPGSGARGKGFEGGRSIPSPEPSVYTLGRPAHDQVGQPALALRQRIDHIEPPPSEAALDPFGPLPDGGEVEGLHAGTAASDSRPGSALSVTGRGNLTRTVTGNAVPRA